jgi:hypothetical protein
MAQKRAQDKNNFWFLRFLCSFIFLLSHLATN